KVNNFVGAVCRYTPGVHNVVRVSGVEFQRCEAVNNTDPLTTGNDVITLLTPGRKWYICSVPRQCAARNMKLNITVLSEVGSPFAAPGPIPGSQTPSSSTRGSAVFSFYGWIAFMVSFVGVLLV
ncbi:blue copper protein-like, partial [Gossypium hirsutum]|uniref:Blue copper protein-like n=1 Tax=Gossypium hirsutum TaxID=3635 RepID=A0A1U8LIW1_GOSHI